VTANLAAPAALRGCTAGDFPGDVALGFFSMGLAPGHDREELVQITPMSLWFMAFITIVTAG